MTFQLLKRNNTSHPFSLKRKSAGKDWFSSFINRQLGLRKPTETFLGKAVGLNKVGVAEIFNLLQKTIKEQNYGLH